MPAFQSFSTDNGDPLTCPFPRTLPRPTILLPSLSAAEIAALPSSLQSCSGEIDESRLKRDKAAKARFRCWIGLSATPLAPLRNAKPQAKDTAPSVR